MENTEIGLENVSATENQIKEIVYNDVWLSNDFNIIDDKVRKLEKLIFSMDNNNSCAEHFMENIPLDILKLLNNGYCLWETEIENQFASKLLLDDNVNIKDYELYNRFQRLLSKEIELLNDHDYETVMFIGSGPFPITAILFHYLTGKNVDCLELDHESANTSIEVFKNLGLSDKIKVHVGNGGTFDLCEYDIVLNALLAKPKFKIMQNVLRSGKPDCHILCRTSEGIRQLLYETTSEDIINGFNVLGYHSAGYDDTISTALLSKKR